MPSLTRLKLMRAEARSQEARHSLRRTIDEIKARLTPAALAQTAQEEIVDAAEAVARKGADLTRRHPAKLIGGALLVLALALRKPLRRRKRRKKPDHATRV